MLDRERQVQAVLGLLKRHRVVGLVGARQVGKTTLARMVAKRVKQPVAFFDLEDPEGLARMQDPMLALRGLRGLVVIDEVQRLKDLYPVLRVLVDRPRNPARFLVLGSASPELLRQGSETLAGRIVYHELGGFCLDEVGPQQHERLWLRGGMPRSYLARSLKESHEWRRSFVRTFLERDMPQLGININATALRRFWTMIAHYHAQTWSASEFARSFGVGDSTVRGYLDRLAAALVVRQLQPWHANVSKRQVRAPKVYVADSGLLHVLLNLRSRADLEAHPKVGASWEGFVIEQIRSRLGAELDECFFWATHAGAELDLLVARGRTRLGFEIKRTTAPKVTPSMRHALTDLELARLDVVHAGETTFPLAERIRAVSFSRLLTDLKPLA
jgi:predicted AAA+ superfamily ATPase